MPLGCRLAPARVGGCGRPAEAAGRGDGDSVDEGFDECFALVVGSAGDDVGDVTPVRHWCKPNKHLAFGIGPHYCIGHSVARVGLKILYGEMFTGFEDFRPAGPAQRLRSTFVLGYKHVPITARRRRNPVRPSP
jgi:hypothetical protein